uniref:Ribosomal protein L29 n=1 Tax=Bostrychia simpliciuscula TaxID=324754 RepID=A0A1Z1M7R1_9FLOR|nr:ribosomal protein L29 [Bostrychia simpliciuscula]ARW62128.1 ribosomal protein L29 [Bostrychia simpliciuscula]
MTQIDKKENYFINITETNSQVLKLKKELTLLKNKEKTKQKVKPHIIKKIKNKISHILTIKNKK